MNTYSMPFPPLEVPPYVEVSVGRWHLRRQDPPPVPIRGYFRGHQVMEVDNWILCEAQSEKVEIWMSITPMELESSAHHKLAAKGNVLVSGLGMGLLPWNIAQKEEVRQIVVVERDIEVIQIMKEVAQHPGWETYRDKLVLMHGDIMEFKSSNEFDVALIDIWDGVGDMRIRGDMRTIAKHVKAKEYAAWGMELDFISWAIDEGVPPFKVGPEHWAEYSESIGIPLIMRDFKPMASLAVRAAELIVLGYDGNFPGQVRKEGVHL